MWTTWCRAVNASSSMSSLIPAGFLQGGKRRKGSGGMAKRCLDCVGKIISNARRIDDWVEKGGYRKWWI